MGRVVNSLKQAGSGWPETSVYPGLNDFFKSKL